jgi:transcriptional regulator with XRE-family HTH domain
VLLLREYRNMTVLDVSRLSRFSLQRIEDIESGIETWLSATDRQILAKALSVEPSVLKEVESRPVDPEAPDVNRTHRELETAIIQGARDLPCPQCGQPLRCSVQDGYDFDGLPIRFAKAFCSRCPYVFR